MSKPYTAEDVRNILTSLAEEYLVDIPAKHADGLYLLEYNDIATAFILGNEEWYEDIAELASNIELDEDEDTLAIDVAKFLSASTGASAEALHEGATSE